MLWILHSKIISLSCFIDIGDCVVMTIVFVLMFGFDLKGHPKPKKIWDINIGNIREKSWIKLNCEGLKAACDDFGIDLVIRGNILKNSGQCPAVIQELIDEGVGMIFMASYNCAPEAQDLIAQHPEILFTTNSAEVTAKNLVPYFARMYQGRYLTGALAGMRTKSNVIGYVAAMPNSKVYRGINAFTLGFQRTNSNAKVKNGQLARRRKRN